MTNASNKVTLNSEQQKAVEHFRGPCLVTAVPGSGKTSTLTSRVIKLMERGVSPHNICCITFTNKAAQEMKERICSLEPEARKAWISTFHKLCVRVLRKYGDLVGLREGFSIYDDEDSNGVMTKVHRMWAYANNEDAKLDPGSRQALRSRVDDLRESAKPFNLDTEDERLSMYLDELHSANAVDFSGMLYLTWRILSKNDEVRASLTKKFEFILVDEAQDNNDIQYAIVKLLASHGNLFMVGDFQQCVHIDEKIPILKNGVPEYIRAGDLPKEGKVLSYKTRKIVYSPYVCQKSTASKGFRFTTKSGATLTVSSRHGIFSTDPINLNGFLLYLMFRPDKGFRIGITKGQNYYGFRMRQEFATKLWILETLFDKETALLREQTISLTFGVPTCVFNAKGRGINQDRVDKVFNIFGENGKAVLDHYDLDFEKPLWSAQSITKKRFKRNNVYLYPHGIKGSLVSMEWSDPELTDIIKKFGMSITASKATKNYENRWRLRKTLINYKEAECFAECLAAHTNSDIIEKLKIESKYLKLTTASAVRLGCFIPVKTNDNIILDEIIDIKPIQGEFISLDVDTGMFFNANGVLSHNSIFSWRGANPTNLNKFLQDYPETVSITLPRNYRSRSEILDKALNIIHHNDDAKDVELISERGSGGDVHVNSYETEWEEADGVAAKMKKYNKLGYSWEDMAVIYRLNKMSQAFEISLAQNGIPYKTRGGQSFFSRREIKTALAYLRLLINPSDSAAFSQAVSNPKRGVGDTLLGKIETLSRDESIDITEAALKIKAKTKIAQSGLAEFLSLMDKKRESLTSGKSLMVIADELLKESGYHYQLCKDAEEEKEGPRSLMRLENLEKFVEGIGDFEEANSKPNMQKFLQQIALVQDGDNNKNPDSVSLMTMHAAKGLEFPVVFVVGVNYEVVPHIRSVEERKEPEERRLFYVALTRAKDHLHVSFPQMKRKWNKMIDMSPSPYLKDMLGLKEDKDAVD